MKPIPWIRQHQLVSFFCLSYIIAFASIFGLIYLKPGQPLQSWSLAWFLFAFSPSIASLAITALSGGRPAVVRLLSGFTRWNSGFRWYFAAVFLFLGPLFIALVYIALGNPIEGLKPGETALTLAGQLLFNLFSGPLSEELGWRGFALPRLQKKFSALVSSLILGVIWCCWHIPLYFLTGSDQLGIPFPIYLALIVTLAVYFTWLYNNTHGSLIITVLAHLAFNSSGGFIAGKLGLMPPMLFYMTSGPLLALIVVGIVLGFGQRRLSKKPAEALPFQPANP